MKYVRISQASRSDGNDPTFRLRIIVIEYRMYVVGSNQERSPVFC